MHISEVLPNVVSLDNARIRKATGQPLTDPPDGSRGTMAHRSRVTVGSFVTTATGLIVRVQKIFWLEGKLRAHFIVAGCIHSELVDNLTPTQSPPDPQATKLNMEIEQNV